VGVARVALAVVVVLAIASGCTADLPDPREATDCVAFTRDAQAESEGGIGGVLPAGAAETVAVDAYWLGPEAFRRQAIFSVSGNVNSGSGKEPFYSTVYQEPRFGCSSNYLPGYEFAPDYWGPGNKLEVENWPSDSGAARDDIKWFNSLGERPRRVRVSTGETATILGFDGFRSGILVGETFVVIEATADKTAAALRSLQRVG
jgi:hypothetical protein